MSGITVNLDKEVIESQLSKSIANGVAEGVASWDLRKQIADMAKSAVLENGKIPQMLQESLFAKVNENTEMFVKETVEECMPAIKAAFVTAVRQSMQLMVYGLFLGLPDLSKSYREEEKKAWSEAEKAMKNAPRNTKESA